MEVHTVTISNMLTHEFAFDVNMFRTLGRVIAGTNGSNAGQVVPLERAGLHLSEDVFEYMSLCQDHARQWTSGDRLAFKGGQSNNGLPF